MTDGKEEFVLEPFYVKDLVKEFWVRKLQISIIMFLILLITVFWLASVDRVYKASIVLGPVANSMGTTNGGGGGQLSALTSLVGMGGAGENVIFAEHLALLRSPELARRLDNKYDLRKKLFSSLWDKETQTWRPSEGLVSRFKLFVKGVLGYPEWTAPDHVSLQAGISSRLTVIDHTLGTPLKRVEFSHPNKELVGKILGWMVDEANQMLREKKVIETEQQIQFLTDRLQSIKNLFHQEAIASLLLDQERMYLLVQSPSGPGATIFDPLIVENNPVFPKITMTLVLAIFVAGMISIVYVYTSMAYKNRK